MAFVAKTFEQILIDMINHVRANTTLTDFTIGSIIRTILEACALEDDEQYFQMVQLLDAFRIQTATGTDLDQRAADLNLTRFSAAAAFGKVVFQDEALAVDALSFNATSLDTLIVLDDSSDFPISYPYDVRIGEGTSAVEDATVSNNDTVSNVLSVSALANNHIAGARVTHVTGSNKIVATGTQVQVPAKGDNLAIKYTTTEPGTIVVGNFQSGLVDIKAIDTGSDGLIAAGEITQFVTTPPITGLTVTNITATTGGRDREADDAFRDRLISQYDVIHRGTPFSVENAVVGTSDPSTGQRITTAKLVENFLLDDHRLFVDDGTGLVPDETRMASTTVSVDPGVGSGFVEVDDVDNFPSSGWVLLSPNVAAVSEILEYDEKDDSVSPPQLIFKTGITAFAHGIGHEAILVDLVGTAEAEQNYFQLADFPVKANSFELYDNESGEYVKKVEGVDYFVNRSNGEIQYAGLGLSTGTIVVANYTYYTGLIATVQKVLNGDPDDASNYPGVVAGGVIINVDIPTLRQVSIVLAITADAGFDEEDLKGEVERVISNYITSRRIGQDIILAEIITLSMLVEGVIDSNITAPTSNIVILEDELSIPVNSLGTSLITVL